jgi:hypothetical protein
MNKDRVMITIIEDAFYVLGAWYSSRFKVYLSTQLVHI